MPINTNPTSTGINLQSKPLEYSKKERYKRTISARELTGDVKSAELSSARISALQTDAALTDLRVIRAADQEKSVALNPTVSSQDISIGALEDIPKDLQDAGVNPLRAELISIFQFFPKRSVQNNTSLTWSSLYDLIDLRFFERELSRTNVQLAFDAINIYKYILK